MSQRSNAAACRSANGQRTKAGGREGGRVREREVARVEGKLKDQERERSGGKDEGGEREMGEGGMNEEKGRGAEMESVGERAAAYKWEAR